MKFRQYLLIAASILGLAGVLAGCKDPTYPDIDAPDPNRSGTNEITEFDFKFSADEYPDYQPGDAAEVKYFPEKDSVYVIVPWYAGIILAPEITVSSGATVAPISGSVRDFSQGSVGYTVRAENGQKKEWRVYVKWREEPEPMPRDPNPRHLLDDGGGKYRIIKFNTIGNSYGKGGVTRSPTTVSSSTNLANAYITNIGAGTEDRYHDIYFIARHAGELQMALEGRTGNATGNTINVRAFINGTQAIDEDGVTPYDHSYFYNKTAITDTLTLHRLILPEIPEGHAGHKIKLEIRGNGTRSGDYYYRFYNMWVSGWGTRGDNGAIYDNKTSGVNFSYSTPRDGSNAPSIHMNMNPPAGNMEYFYTEITVPSGYDPINTYFMTSGNGQGYAGIQVNGAADRRFLFSIWSAAEESDNSTLKSKYNPKLVRVCNQPEHRSGITYQVFGGEGTGGQSRINARWEADKTYKVLVRIRPHPDQVRFPNSTLYKAWFHNGTEWLFMCEWRRPEIQPGDKGVTAATVKGPYWYTSASHFVEDFAQGASSTGYPGDLPHKAYYGNHWFITDRGEYVEPASYSFSNDQAEGRYDTAGGVESDPSSPYYNMLYMSTGGYFTEYRYTPRPFRKVAPATMPDLDLSALNAMGTDDPSKDSALSPNEQYTE